MLELVYWKQRLLLLHIILLMQFFIIQLFLAFLAFFGLFLPFLVFLALKAVHIGISLSKAEASVAASFTSQVIFCYLTFFGLFWSFLFPNEFGLVHFFAVFN